MTNLFGHSVRSELLLLSVTEALACFAAFALILHLGLPPGTTADLPGILVLSGVLAICASFAVAATGLYHPTNSLRAARLFAGAVLGGLLLVIVAPVAAHMLPHAPLPGIGMSVTQLVVAFFLGTAGTGGRVGHGEIRKAGHRRSQGVDLAGHKPVANQPRHSTCSS